MFTLKSAVGNIKESLLSINQKKKKKKKKKQKNMES
jgi:hypothetical protein